MHAPRRLPRPHRTEIAPDTLGELADHEFRLLVWCARCWKNFDIDLGVLSAERGRKLQIVGLAPVSCPRCHSRRTEIRLLPPKTGDGVIAHSSNDGRSGAKLGRKAPLVSAKKLVT
jgi:DNA-directed RNA polymerase subunit RPC12/RpoP